MRRKVNMWVKVLLIGGAVFLTMINIIYQFHKSVKRDEAINVNAGDENRTVNVRYAEKGNHPF